jgi:acyl-CoA thioesterase FadM
MTAVSAGEDVCPVQIRANDFDWSGSLNNSVYLELFEQGRWSWARKHGINEAITRVFAVVSEATIQFISPIRWNPTAVVTVQTKLCLCRAFSFWLDQAIYDNETLIAAGKLRLALVGNNGQLIRSDLLFRRYALVNG